MLRPTVRSLRPPPLISSQEDQEDNDDARGREVDPSLMPRRAVLGWNFKQQHLVDREHFLLGMVLISRALGGASACQRSLSPRERGGLEESATL